MIILQESERAKLLKMLAEVKLYEAADLLHEHNENQGMLDENQE